MKIIKLINLHHQKSQSYSQYQLKKFTIFPYFVFIGFIHFAPEQKLLLLIKYKAFQVTSHVLLHSSTKYFTFKSLIQKTKLSIKEYIDPLNNQTNQLILLQDPKLTNEIYESNITQYLQQAQNYFCSSDIYLNTCRKINDIFNTIINFESNKLLIQSIFNNQQNITPKQTIQSYKRNTAFKCDLFGCTKCRLFGCEECKDGYTLKNNACQKNDNNTGENGQGNNNNNNNSNGSNGSGNNNNNYNNNGSNGAGNNNNGSNGLGNGNNNNGSGNGNNSNNSGDGSGTTINNNGNGGQIICSEFCDKCTSSINCTQCQENYFLNNNSCSQSIPISGRFSSEQVKATKESAQQANTALLASSSSAQLLTSFSNPNSQMLMQMLAIQKVYFLLLVNIPLPDILYNFILGISGKLIMIFTFLLSKPIKINHTNPYTSSSPVFQIQKINFLNNAKDLYENDKNITIGDQFQKQKISSSIIISNGGTLFMYIFLNLILLIFFYLIKWSKTGNIAIKVFDKLASGLIVQFNQLLILIISFGLFMQLKEFFLGNCENNLGLKIFFVILLTVILLFICYAQVKISSKNYFSSKIIYENQQDLQKEVIKILEQDKDQNELSQVKITTFVRERIQNDCLKEVTIQRVYMNIYLAHEAILIPFIIVTFSQYFYLQIIFLTFTQILLAMTTIYLRPFYQTIDNLFFITDQILWGFTFLIFAVLSFMINHLESQIIAQTISSQQVSSIDALSMMLIVQLILIQLLNPLVSFIKIGVEIHKMIKQHIKNKKKINQQESELINTSLESIKKQIKI